MMQVQKQYAKEVMLIKSVMKREVSKLKMNFCVQLPDKKHIDVTLPTELIMNLDSIICVTTWYSGLKIWLCDQEVKCIMRLSMKSIQFLLMRLALRLLSLLQLKKRLTSIIDLLIWSKCLLKTKIIILMKNCVARL